MLVLACFLIQTHDVTKSPLSCFVTVLFCHIGKGPAPCARRPVKEKVPSPGPLVTW